MYEKQKNNIKEAIGNKYLFRKELNKSLSHLNPHELTNLRKWLKNNYWRKYKTEITEILYP